jgi:hypothetical protein
MNQQLLKVKNMKLTKKIVALVAVLMTTASVLASEVTVITMLNGSASSTVGTVESSVSNGVCTLTVTPASGYYIDVITAEKTVDGGMAQAPRRRTAPGMDNYLQVTAPQSPFDPSVETTWTFSMPSSEYNVEVVANFKERASISSGSLELTLPQDGFAFDGQAKEPAVTVTLDGSTLANSNYTVDYSNNINAGTATVTVTGVKTYQGTLTQDFAIGKAALSNLSVMIEGWTFGQYDEEVNAPRVNGNVGEGTENFTYSVANRDNFSTTVPEDAGSYTVKVVVAETDNYQAGEATADFTIGKAELSDATVSLVGWTYGDEANIPEVNGNLGEGEVDFFYANAEAPSSDYTTDVPTNAGNYSVKAVIAETDNYLGKEVTNTFSIAKANLSVVTIADIADQTYTGQAVEPIVNVTFNGETVDADEYTVGYSNNTNVGEATVTLTATGINFTAGTTATKTFQIMEANAVISAEDQTVTYNGEGQEFTNWTVDNGAVDVAYFATEADRTAGDNQLEVAPLDAGTYYVLLTQSDENYHSDPATALFVIEPKALTEDMVQDLVETSFVYDGNAKTLSFSIKDGESVLVENEDYTVSYSDNINVGVATATVTGMGNYTGFFILDFEILRKLNISFSETNSWATYCATEDLSIPEGLDAYIVTGIDGSSVSVEQIDYLPATEGVLLHLEEPALASDAFIAGKANAAHSELPENLLVGLTAATPVRSLTTENMNIYILYNDEFVKTTTGTIPANRCFLFVDLDVNAEARLSIDFETTGIEKLTKDLSNVKGAYYDLQGRKVAQPVKGLYIVNGRKVVVK